VVDSGSKDGVQYWLKMLARRGDIELISSVGNIGHGEGLELARKMSRSEYLVSLDSDAFPLREGWLEEMRSRLNDRVLVTGILHHRDYVHPSCLMISRRTMDRMQLSFLDEKQQKSGLDVGERISVSIKENGYRISGIRRTGYQCRGSRSEPVCLGSEYEGLVYHQWYMTRSAISGGAPVDDVPNEDLKRSLEGLLSSGECEFRDVAVVIGARYDADAPERLRNLRAVIERMNLQSMHRWRYRLVLVEQDKEPRLNDDLQSIVDVYKFAYNPGPYNRSWGFNVGAKLIGDSAKVICFLDADLLVPKDFLIRGLLCIENGAVALQPYRQIVYLEESSTQEVLEQCANDRVETFDEKRKGKRFTDSHGGCLWVKPGLYP
jgi:glycosyltransferase involved in cell wall biosynthesis